MHPTVMPRLIITPKRGEDLVAVLLEDHARTGRVVQRALTLAQASATEEGVANVAAGMRAFFRYWSPLHELDEEASVAPALLAHAPDVESRLVVARIVDAHQRLNRDRDAIARVWDALADNPAEIEVLRSELLHGTKVLARELAVHEYWEEKEFFPRVRLHVPARVQAQILAVMRARRGQPTRSRAA